MNPEVAEHHHLPLLPLTSNKTKKQAFLMASAPNSNPNTTPSPPPPPSSSSSSSPSSSVSTTSHGAPSITAMDYDHIVSVLHLLPLDSILCFSMTCRKFRSLASSESLWEFVCRRDWGSRSVDDLVSSFSSVERREMSWKRLYRQVSQLSSLSCRRLASKDGIFPRPRASHSLNYVSDCLVLFGGGCEGGRHLDDTWVAYIGNGFNRVLRWQQVKSGIPNGRFGHSCIIIADSLVLFGGINDSGVRHNDTWIGQLIHEGPLDIKISWRPLDVGPVAPAPRGAHAACCTGEQKMVIHGGIGFNGLRLDDTWVLDLADDLISARWFPITNAQLSPPARSGHSLTWISGCHMVLYGGRGSGYDVLNDVWLLDIGRELPEWMELKYDNSNILSEMPLPRVGHSATLIAGGQVVIYGGEDSQRHRKNDFWILDVGMHLRSQTMGLKRPLKIWKKLRLEGHCPSYRSFHGTCTDRSGRNVFIFGGMVDGVVHPAEAYGLRFDGELYLVELVLQL